VVIGGEAHLRRLLKEFLHYYTDDRCHLALDKDPPSHRPVETRPAGPAKVASLRRVGGIHHRYEWREAA
jgi:hypothetical protein